MSNSPVSLTLNLEMTDHEAWCLAQFLKRVGFGEVRVNAEDENQAYVMIDAMEKVRESLAEAGYAPR